jgi:hypothetical protein
MQKRMDIALSIAGEEGGTARAEAAAQLLTPWQV